MNKLNKIDYELRNMKMPFLNDAPLASSYAEKSGYAVLSDDTYFTIKDDFSNATGDTLASVQDLIDKKVSDITLSENKIIQYLDEKAINQNNYDSWNNSTPSNKSGRDEKTSKKKIYETAINKYKTLAEKEQVKLETLKTDLLALQARKDALGQIESDKEIDDTLAKQGLTRDGIIARETASSKTKIVLIVGGLAVVGLIAMLVLKRN